MKACVMVTVTAEVDVEIEVDHEEGDDPADLTKEDKKRVRDVLPDHLGPEWSVSMDAEEVQS